MQIQQYNGFIIRGWPNWKKPLRCSPIFFGLEFLIRLYELNIYSIGVCYKMMSGKNTGVDRRSVLKKTAIASVGAGSLLAPSVKADHLTGEPCASGCSICNPHVAECGDCVETVRDAPLYETCYYYHGETQGDYWGLVPQGTQGTVMTCGINATEEIWYKVDFGSCSYHWSQYPCGWLKVHDITRC